ncbi:hypothetical protein RHMOL_Rhmol13G0271000 [Rhododendron molle]|uniref:Uncharacterized protein n=1 Tax=Rhododendron molle TaxID=49168 RepID=A0ACC0LCS9_RHOML|nr:hypothetical protein RHMOL_Rhmol13G0271000 [Rhododendron molle]
MEMEFDVFAANPLNDMYVESGNSTEASIVIHILIFEAVSSMQQQDLLDKFQALGETPNSVTFSNVLPGCAIIGFLRAGKEIHARSIRTGSE